MMNKNIMTPQKRERLYKFFLILSCAVTAFATTMRAQERKQYDVAAYLYPAYAYNDPRLRPFWPAGMGEWETVMNMQQRNPGHYWNRRPIWGPINEADPAIMEMEIEQATKHGVNVFIFDWYWFDCRPFMETTLTDGFLKARNRDKMKFYLMWANHDVVNTWDTRISNLDPGNVIWQGSVDRDEFERLCRRNIEKFFKQPEYYKIDGKPVFMIYEVTTFIRGLGGVEQAKDALKWFRKEVKKAGFPDLELQFVAYGANYNYSGVDKDKERIQLSLKAMQPQPWDIAEEKYPVDAIVEGKVVRITTFGAFVELEAGLDGLVHISQCALKRIAKVEDAVQVGQVVRVKVLKVDTEAKRISLSIREALTEEVEFDAEVQGLDFEDGLDVE